MKSLTEYVLESKAKEYSCISTMQDFLDEDQRNADPSVFRISEQNISYTE